jgi:hypothetical protein
MIPEPTIGASSMAVASASAMSRRGMSAVIRVSST